MKTIPLKTFFAAALLASAVFMSACLPKNEGPEPLKPIAPPTQVSIKSVLISEYHNNVAASVSTYAARWDEGVLSYDLHQKQGLYDNSSFNRFFTYKTQGNKLIIRKFARDPSGADYSKDVAELSWQFETAKVPTSYTVKLIEENDYSIKGLPGLAETNILYNEAKQLPIRTENSYETISVSYQPDGSLKTLEVLKQQPSPSSTSYEFVYSSEKMPRIANPGIYTALLPIYFCSPSSSLGFLYKHFKMLPEPQSLPVEIIATTPEGKTTTYKFGYEWYKKELLKVYRFQENSTGMGEKDSVFEVQFNTLKPGSDLNS